MPQVTIQGFGRVNFPEGMAPQDIQSAIERDIVPVIQSRREAGQKDIERMADPLAGTTPSYRAVAGYGKAGADIARGIGQTLGLVSREDVAEARKRDEPLMRSSSGMAGNIAGNIATLVPTAAIPGAATLRGAAAIGAGIGAISPSTSTEETLANIGGGAALAAGGQAAARGLARAISPRGQPAAQALAREGVELTPGQILGPTARRIEEGLTSIPFTGDVIRSAQRRTIESFNRAALARALTPIGERTNLVGYEGVKEVGKKLGAAYDELLPKLRIKADQAYTDELIDILDKAKVLQKSDWEQLHTIIREQLGTKFDKRGEMAGEVLKGAESELGRLARGYSSDASFDKRQLGQLLQDVQAATRAMVERANPQYADRLSKINEGWANLLRVQRAAGAAGSKEGVFTPEALRSSVKAFDSSRNRARFARGEALMQDLARSAEGAMGRTVPDSGTPFRSLVATGLPGLLSAAASSPIAAAYTRTGQGAMRGLLTKRPGNARQLADQMRRFGLLAPAVSAGTSE